MSNLSEKENHEAGFYKGLFYGVVLGVGLIWFLGTKEGKKVKEELLDRGENLLNKAAERFEATLEGDYERPQ